MKSVPRGPWAPPWGPWALGPIGLGAPGTWGQTCTCKPALGTHRYMLNMLNILYPPPRLRAGRDWLFCGSVVWLVLVSLKICTEKPKIHPAENISGRQRRKKNRGQKPKKYRGEKPKEEPGPMGPQFFFGFSPRYFFWLLAPVLFLAFGPGCFFQFSANSLF